GTNWAQRQPAASPPSRLNSGMAYDLTRACTVLFGGGLGFGSFGDTWEWDGSNWTQRTPGPGPLPPPRDDAASVYDPIRARTVLFGGSGSNGVMLADTWEWDGTQWFHQTPATAPTPRSLHAMAFDSQRGRALLFGGSGGSGTLFGDTWQWDG